MRKFLCFFLVLGMIVSVTGCSKPKPEDAVSGCLDSLINGDFEEAAKYLNYENSDIEENDIFEIGETDDPETAKALKNSYGKIEYEILNSSVDGDKAEVEIEITIPDLASVLSQLMMEALPLALEEAFNEIAEDDNASDENDNITDLMNTKLIEKLNSDDVPMVTKTMNINLTSKNNKWLIEVEGAFLDIITGNMATMLEDLVE